MVTPVKSNQQFVFIHDSICEGPIQGLLYGDASVYLNGNRARDIDPDAPFSPINGNITFSGTTGTVSGVSIPTEMVGTPLNDNYLAIRNSGISKDSTSGYSATTGQITIDGASNFSSAYETIDDASKFIVLADIITNEVFLVGDGELDGTNLKFTPSANTYNQNYYYLNTYNYKVQLLELVEISSITSTTIVTSSAPSLGNIAYTFVISGSNMPSPEDINAENPVKVSGFNAQFRNGSLYQAPISELNGVGGGTSYTGNPGNLTTPLLKQLNVATWNSDNPGDTLLGGANGYSTTGYPSSQTGDDFAASPTEIASSFFSGGSASVVPTLDEIRIGIQYNQCIAINKSNGDEYSNNAIYLFQIATKAPGAASFGPWQHAFRNTEGTHIGQIFHNAKEKSAFSMEHFIDLSFFKPFDDFKIRVTRLTRHKGTAVGNRGEDQNSDHDQGDTTSTLSTLVGINKDKFSYPHTAHIGVFLDSKEFGSVPKRSYEIRGLKVKIPKGYVPREYTSNGVATYPEFWTGAFEESLFYTDNPAWVFYDIVTNNRFGAGDWVNADDIDKYSLYRIAQYCDELVDDGKGGTEPRFRANVYLAKATDVYKVLKDMATIFGSMLYWLDGRLTPVLDAPADPVYSFSKANVIDGTFTYESTGQKTRTNQVVVTWNNPEIGYEQQALIVEDRVDIARTGRIIKEDAFAFGCTSEGQARRYGKWKLFTAQNQSEIVSFSTSFEGLFLKPGDVIQVQDSARYGATLSGRIVEHEPDYDGNLNTKVTLDRPVTLNSDAAYSYELSLVMTESAAFYAGEIDSSSPPKVYNSSNSVYQTITTRGERVLKGWVDTDEDGVDEAGDSRSFRDLNTEERASNAWTRKSGGELMPLVWKKDSFVETKSISKSDSGNTSTSGNMEVILYNPFTTTANPKSIWMLKELVSGTSSVGSPDLYRVLGIAKDNNNTYTISAVEHHPQKYDYIDDPDAIVDIPDDLFPGEQPVFTSPTNLYILQNSNAAKPNEELILAWDFPNTENTKYLDGFEIAHNIADEEEIITVAKGRRRYAFNEVPNGEYVFRVRAVSVRENKSAWLTARYIVDDPFSDNVNRDKGLQLEGLASQFPFVTNETAATGHFRGEFDSSLGAWVYSTNEDGYKTYDIVTTTSGAYKYLPSDGNATQISTWKEYRGGILKFRHDVSAVLAPSRFRRSDAVSLSSNFTFDVNIVRNKEWVGNVDGSTRTAYVVLDQSNSSLKLIHARFDEDLNFFYWYDLHEALDENNTTDLSKYWTTLPGGGTVSIASGSNKVIGTGTSFTSLNNLNKLRFSSSFGAKVAYIESNTVMYLDRRCDTAISAGTTAYVQKYAPDFRKDVIIGRISVPNNGRSSFTFENFLTLDPNLEGNRSVLIDSNVAFLQYDPDENLTLAPDAISIEATAIGFDEPVFKVTYGDPSTAPLDENNSPTIFEPEQTTFSNPNKGIYGYTFNVWDGSDPIPYDGGASYTIQVEVVEKEDQGNTDKGVSSSITIGKVGDVAAASGGRSVFMELEDYSIIYNSTGKKPVYNGQPNYSATPNAVGNILFSATASPGFGSPIFRWKVDGTAIVPDPTNYPNATWYEAGGGGDLATYDWPVPATLGDATNGFNWTNVNGGSKSVTVEVAEKPTGWTATVPGSGTNTNEVTDADIFAKDVDNILAIRVNAGGLTINFVNDSHIIPCDAEGVVLSSANSGGSIEVFMGGQGVDYTTSGTPDAGQFTIGSITSTESDKITIGSITATTQSNGPTIATIADHTFTGTLDDTSNTGFETQEAITYPLTVYPHDGGDAITTSVTQVFTLVKNGAQAGTGVIYLYATGRTASDLTTINSSFPIVRVTMADGSVNHSATTGFPTVFQDSDYGYYTSPTGASTVGQPGDVLWVIGATANSNGADDFILYDEWTDPVQFSGTDGINSRVLELYASHDGEDANGNPTPPALNMSDITYTFATGALSYTTLGNWSETMPSPSRSTPYVWRTTAAALSNTATTVIDGKDGASDVTTDWSNAVLMNRFVEDGITLELDNDAETVGAEEGSAVGSAANPLSVATTAKIFQGGADVSNQWDFNATLPANLTCNTKTSTNDPVGGTGTNFNVFTVTQLESNYTSGNIQITASPKTGGTYDGAASRTINFTVTRLNNGEQGVSYRIIPSVTAVSYSAVTSSHTPSGAITFQAQKIDPDGTVTAQTGYWSQTGGGSDTINNNSAASSTTVTPNTGNNATNNITVDFYLSYDSSTSTLSNLVDRETVQITPDGNNGSAVDIWFARTSGTPTVTSVNSSGVPQGNVTWVTSIANTSGTTQLWAVVVKKAVNATTYTNDTPYKVNGTAVAEVYCFRKTTGGTALSTAPADTAYNFTNASFTVDTANSWSKNIPAITANQDRIYVSYAIASGTPETTNATLDWSAPVIYSIREDGVNTATITLHLADSQNSSAPAPPDNNNTWTFATAAFASGSDLTNANGDAWSITEPALTATDKYRWSCTQVVSGTGTTATATAGTSGWGTPEVTANYANDPYNTVTITLYQRNNGNSAPTRPSNTSVWNFSSAAFTTAPNNGWSLTAPTLTSTLDTLWSCSQIASSQTNTDNLAANTGWSAPVVVGRFGTDGTQGPQGTQGAQGTQGTQGTRGPTGSQGTRGPTGSQGTRGPTGDPGPTGAAFFRVTSNDNTVPSSKITAGASGTIFGAIGRTYAVEGDVCVVIAANNSQSAGYVYNGTTWSAAGTFITGDLVVDGTIGADQIAANSISASELTLTASSDGQSSSIWFEPSTSNDGPVIKIYDSGLRVKLGKL